MNQYKSSIWVLSYTDPLSRQDPGSRQCHAHSYTKHLPTSQLCCLFTRVRQASLLCSNRPCAQIWLGQVLGHFVSRLAVSMDGLFAGCADRSGCQQSRQASFAFYSTGVLVACDSCVMIRSHWSSVCTFVRAPACRLSTSFVQALRPLLVSFVRHFASISDCHKRPPRGEHAQ